MSRSTRYIARGALSLVAAVMIIVVVTNREDSSSSGVVAAPTTIAAPTAPTVGTVPPLAQKDWDPVVGSWVLEESRARLDSSGTDTESNNLLIVDTGTTDYTIRAALDIPSTSTGLVFRYRDQRNYWGLEAVRYYGLWRVYRVVDGERTDLATFEEPICCRAGVLLSASTTAAGEVVLGIDSGVLYRTEDLTFADATKAGLFSRGDDATDAHLSSVEVLDEVPEAERLSAPSVSRAGSAGPGTRSGPG